jgi:hypothetical protein
MMYPRGTGSPGGWLAYGAFALLLGGCAQLAGIDDTSGDGRVGVSLAVERTSIGATIVRTPQDLSASSAVYLVPDEADPALITEVPAVETEPGLWTADVFGPPPPVLFDLPDNPPFQRLVTVPTRDLLTTFDVLEHPNAVPSDPNAMLGVNVTLDAPFVSGTFDLFVVGTWTAINLGAPVAMTTTLAPPPFPISAMGTLTGRPADAITTDDVPIIYRRQGNQLDAVLEVTPFAQTGNDTLTGTVTPVALDRTLDLQVDPAAATSRFGTVRPANGAPSFSWDLHAAPGAELGFNTGPLLHAAGVTIETAVTAAYANPFVARGWQTVLAWNGSSSRSATHPSQLALPATLSAGMSQLIADPQAGLVLDFPAGLPEQISIAGTSLSRDDITLSAFVGPVEIVADVDRTGASLYTLEVRELTPNMANTALEARRTLFVAAPEPRFTLRPTDFEVGKLYTLRIQSIHELFTNASAGDLQTRALPAATAFADSGIFLVVP